MPNFSPKNIVDLVSVQTQAGLVAAKEAEQGTNWYQVFDPLDKADFALGQILNVNAHLNSVRFSEQFNRAYEKTLPIINDYYHQISTNKKLYQTFLNLKNSPLNNAQRHILAEVLEDFVLSGLNLDNKDLEKFKEISKNLSLLANQFSKNVLKASNSWQQVIHTDELGKDYPKNLLAKLAHQGKLVVNLQTPIYLDIISYADSSKLRERIYKAYISRASEVGITDKKYDNSQIIGTILQLRKQKAQLLGFNNYAELSLAKKMLQNPDKVIAFLETLIAKIYTQAQLELNELKDFANKDLLPWDLSFYSEKLKDKKYGFSKADLQPYFPEEQVLSGLFALLLRLYGIGFRLIKEPSYHRDVRVFELYDKKILIGKIYLDLYARKNKRSGAWMADYQGLYGKDKPIAFVVCNLNKANKDTPALFDFDEVVTLFHEFGHALHHLLTTTPYPSVSGINGVPWDGVELPSQMMELFCYERFVIDLISRHYQSGAKLPDDLYQKLIAAKHFQSAMQLLRQCEFALWDMQVHIKDDDAYTVLAAVREKTALLPVITQNRFLHAFSHIFSGGYAAGYYSYLWAEVLAADAFLHLKKHNFDTSVVQAFRKYILAVGGSADFSLQYQKFRGKLPNINALLESRGLNY